MPQLAIDVEARIAKFQDSLDLLSRDVTRQVRGMERAFGALGSAFGGVAAAVGAGSVGVAVKSVIDSMAALDDASIQTGASVESLSSLLNTLAPTGVTLDQISDIAGKLARSMAEAQKEGSDAARAFAALGVSTVDSNGNLRAVDDTLTDVARALNGYADGTGKVALAQALLTRSGAGYLTVLKDLAEFQRQGASVTTEQAQAAADFGDQIGRLTTSLREMGQQLAGPVIVRLNELIEQFRVGTAAAGGFGQALIKFGLNFQTPEANLERIKNRIAELNEQIRRDGALAEGQGASFGRGARRAAQDRIAAAQEQIKALERESEFFRLLQRQAAGPANDPPPAPRPSAPRAGSGDDDRKNRREQISDGARLLQNLQDQVFATLQLSRVQQLQADIARGRVRFDNDAQRAAALAAAEQIDSVRRISEAADAESAAAIRRIRAYEELEAAQSATNEAAEQSIRAQVEAFADLADPTRAYQRELEKIRELLDGNRITAAQADSFRQNATERLLGTLDDQKNATDDLNNAARDLGFTFQSAFEDAILEGAKLSDVLSGIARDVARIFIRQTITAPLADFISGGVTGLFGGAGGAVAGAAASATSAVATKAVPVAAPALSFDLRNSALTPDFIQGVVAKAVGAARDDRYDLQFRGRG